MRILVVAPHPFYQERGTPIAVDLVLRALSERGDHVDLLTYHEGSDRAYPRLRILRIKPILSISDVRPGFSAKKVVCDAHMLFRLISLMATHRYDVVHAVEEAGFIALAVCPLRSTPFVVDIDSSMTTQLVDKYPVIRPFERICRLIESLPIRFAEAVIPVCNALAADVMKYRVDGVTVLKDISLLDATAVGEAVPSIREEFHLTGQIVMYIGNLEPYQGIDLLLDSFSQVTQTGTNVALVIIGGAASHITRYRHMAASLGICKHVYFIGSRPVAHMGQYMAQADILVSPRKHGLNTPMKVYSYLHSGTAVLATDLPTHTQVMTSDIAMLASPDKQHFAWSMLRLLGDVELRTRLAASAHAYIEREHSYRVFKETLHSIYAQLEQKVSRR